MQIRLFLHHRHNRKDGYSKSFTQKATTNYLLISCGFFYFVIILEKINFTNSTPYKNHIKRARFKFQKKSLNSICGNEEREIQITLKQLLLFSKQNTHTSQRCCQRCRSCRYT